jgi:hypothetical protein
MPSGTIEGNRGSNTPMIFSITYAAAAPIVIEKIVMEKRRTQNRGGYLRNQQEATGRALTKWKRNGARAQARKISTEDLETGTV